VIEGWHPASRALCVHGERMHFVDQGEGGPPLILVHGYLMSSYMWRSNVDALSVDRRVIALCLPGFGWSDVGTGPYDVATQSTRVLGLLDALGIEEAHLAGHSMGGAICLWLARHRPERVRGLVLVNALAIKGTLPSVPWAVVHRSLAFLYRAVVRPGLARVILQRYAYTGMALDQAYMDHFLFPLRRPGGVEAALEAARELRLMAPVLDGQLSLVDREALVVWGTRDRLLPERVGRRLSERIPRARFAALEGCGHSPHEEAPLAFNETVAAFLREA
jgi:pyruvate dehydrogenase E2 component (dihydrolipoamide acetyltransferase)